MDRKFETEGLSKKFGVDEEIVTVYLAVTLLVLDLLGHPLLIFHAGSTKNANG